VFLPIGVGAENYKTGPGYCRHWSTSRRTSNVGHVNRASLSQGHKETVSKGYAAGRSDLVAGARFKRGLPDPEFPLTPAQAALVAGARRKRSLLHAAWDLSAVQRPKTEIDYDALLGLPTLTFP